MCVVESESESAGGGGITGGGGMRARATGAGGAVTVISSRKPPRSRSLVGISQGDRARRVAFGDLRADDQVNASASFLDNPAWFAQPAVQALWLVCSLKRLPAF